MVTIGCNNVFGQDPPQAFTSGFNYPALLGRLPGTAPLQAHIRNLVETVVEEPTFDPRSLADELHDFLFEHLREHLPITNAPQLLELLAKMPR